MTNVRTSDLYYAAYLKVAGVPFRGTERDGTRVYFLFEGVEELSGLHRRWYDRSAQVPAMTYADEVKAMKSLCHV